MLDQPAPLIHMMGDVIRPAPGRHHVLTFDDAMDEAVIRARYLRAILDAGRQHGFPQSYLDELASWARTNASPETVAPEAR